MSNEIEGIVKYSSDWEKKPLDIITEDQLQELNYWRKQLMDRGLIGVGLDGLGYGNISFRFNVSGEFIITGSQTGHLVYLNREDLSLVTGFSLEKNLIRCSGLRQASSEALTHAVFYQQIPSCGGVIHIHNRSFWQKRENDFPVTSFSAEYGTSELARSIMEILQNSTRLDKGIIILGGHPEGVVSFGSSISLAGKEIIKEFDKLES